MSEYGCKASKVFFFLSSFHVKSVHFDSTRPQLFMYAIFHSGFFCVWRLFISNIDISATSLEVRDTCKNMPVTKAEVIKLDLYIKDDTYDNIINC